MTSAQWQDMARLSEKRMIETARMTEIATRLRAAAKSIERGWPDEARGLVNAAIEIEDAIELHSITLTKLAPEPDNVGE